MAIEIGRRAYMAGVGGAAVTFSRIATAQQAAKVSRVGVLWHAVSAEVEGPYFRALRQGFKDLGYVEGHDLKLDDRFPNEEPELFRSMAAELVSLKPDVLIAAGGSAAIAAKNATATIPVVFITVPDPIASKLVDSLARPGGNVTGFSNFAVQLSAKRLEYIKQLLPDLSRVALLVNPRVEITGRYIEESEAAAAQLGLTVQIVEAQSLTDLESAFDSMVKAGAQAVVINAEGLFFTWRTVVAKLAASRALPTCVYSRETLEAGALMSYGPDQPAIFRRAAVYADKILKGAKPAELPVEQPTRFELLVNLRTAKAMGFTVSESFLERADEVIE
jgi:putative ABC transport system substrate-binding protein